MAAVGGDSERGEERFDAASYDVVVPDDARDLELDLLAWRREQAAATRKARVHRLLGAERWRGHGWSAPFVASVLAMVALFGSMLTLLALLLPHGSRDRAPRRPLETAAPSPVGRVGGLLADRRLRVGGKDVAARELRPGVLALLPVPCRCGAVVDELSGQAAEFGLRLVLVAPAERDEELSGLIKAARHGPVVPAYDAEAGLARDYAAHGLTLVLVRDDGRVTGVERDARPGLRRESVLRRLVTSGQPD